MTLAEIQHRFRMMNEDALGNFGEMVVRRILASSRVRYVPLAKIEDGGAPLIKSDDESIVLPDYDAASANWTAYVEAKCKTQSVLHRNSRQIRHGIDRRNWVHYLKAQECFKKQCAVAIVELFDHDGVRWTGDLLMETLRELGEPYQGESNQRHMVYWRKKQFRNLDSFAPDELMAIHDGRMRRSYEIELDAMFNPHKQVTLF